MSLADARAYFNGVVAPHLAAQVGVTTAAEGARTTRFSYFADDGRFVVVAGQQERGYIDLAFALGLTYREHRRLVLVLPVGHAFATLQRAPWFNAEARPEVWLHDGDHVERASCQRSRRPSSIFGRS